MSIYDEYLPRTFPHVIELPRDRARRAVTQLVNGTLATSFAVTSDTYGDTVKLWLSDMSLRRYEALSNDETLGDDESEETNL